MDWAETALAADAGRAHGAPLDWIVAEINDPFRPPAVQDNVDTFARIAVWNTWRFVKLDFPYLQPALSPEQHPVDHLLLAAKILRPEFRDAVPAGLVESVVREYLRWAMRIEQPESRREFQIMQRYLRARSSVATISLARYIGRDPAQPLDVHEIGDEHDADLDATLALYERAFPKGPAAVEAAALRHALVRRDQRTDSYASHLWALRASAADPVEGMASFFTFPIAGFVGYVMLGGSLRGTGRLRLLVARIEEQMIRDALDARGWYAECRADSPEAIALTRVGFFEAALTYRQPRLVGTVSGHATEGPELLLLYKEFGRRYEPPRLDRDSLLDTLDRVFRIVYDVTAGADSHFAELRRQAATWPNGSVPWRARSALTSQTS